MRVLFAAAASLVLIGSAGLAADAVPPEPANHPDWAATAAKGREMLISKLFDPSSAQLRWTSGFQWGFMKPIIGRRTFGWIACGTINAKNRMGGYVGAEGFLVFIDEKGTITADLTSSWVSTCDAGPFTPPGPELVNFDAPATSGSGGSVGIAEELKGLAELRDKGILTSEEFEQQKAKLLAR